MTGLKDDEDELENVHMKEAEVSWFVVVGLLWYCCPSFVVALHLETEAPLNGVECYT